MAGDSLFSALIAAPALPIAIAIVVLVLVLYLSLGRPSKPARRCADATDCELLGRDDAEAAGLLALAESMAKATAVDDARRREEAEAAGLAALAESMKVLPQS